MKMLKFNRDDIGTHSNMLLQHYQLESLEQVPSLIKSFSIDTRQGAQGQKIASRILRLFGFQEAIIHQEVDKTVYEIALLLVYFADTVAADRFTLSSDMSCTAARYVGSLTVTQMDKRPIPRALILSDITTVTIVRK